MKLQGLSTESINRIAKALKSQIGLDEFTSAYIEAALWATDDDNGNPLENNYGVEDFDEQALNQISEDCQKFQKENAEDLEEFYKIVGGKEWSPEAQGGHDFFLTRNHHGAGFWDRGAGDVGERLSDAAHSYGEIWVYVGDDGKLYI